MPLPLETESLDAVDESARGFYAEKDGKFVLEVDGLPDVNGLKSALSAERENAKNLNKELKTYRSTWEGYDKEEVDSLLAKRAEYEKHDASAIEEQIATRVNQNNASWEEKFNALQNNAGSMRQELSKLKVRDELARVGAQLGIGDGAQMEDFLARGERVFKMTEDGDVKPLDPKGEIVYGKSGVEMLTMDEFTKGLAETASHLFKASGGGGASNTGEGGAINIRARSDLKTVKEKSDFISKHGQEAYLQLPAKR